MIAGNLTADEFSAELAEGVAYVAGHDEESRPVTVIFTVHLSLSLSQVSFFLGVGEQNCFLLFHRFSELSKITRSSILKNCEYPKRKQETFVSFPPDFKKKESHTSILFCFLLFLFRCWFLYVNFRFTRLLVFTLEVAIATMSKNVEQFVLLFDASKLLFTETLL